MQTYSTPLSNGPSTPGGASATDQAKGTAGQVAGQAKEQAQQAADQARGALRTQVDQRSTDAGQRVGTFASDVRSVSEQLRQQGKDQPAKIADQAAHHADRLGSYLKQSDADRILGDVEDFGRRKPWAVIAGGAVLGLAAARFLKASSTRRYEQNLEMRRLPARTYATTDVPPPVTTPPIPERRPVGTTPGTTGTAAPGSFEGS